MKSEIRRLPEAFLERLQRIVPPHKWDALANTFAASRPTSFRVNTLKARTCEVREELAAAGFRFERVSWYSDACILVAGRLRDLQETQAYTSGRIYVQSLASMIPALVLDPQTGDEVLDLTAAPGSKTTQMACLMKGQGRILANDNNKVRFYRLKANIEMQGAPNVILSLKYGESFGRDKPEFFDRVLLDAPCSAEGRFDVHDPATYKYWKPSKMREMQHKQKKLFNAAVLALKPGGTLVYSTCTYAPEENEGVVDWALSQFGSVLEMEPVHLELPNQMRGLTSWNKTQYHPSVSRCVRILPTGDMEGFFVARFKKRTA